MNDQGAPPVEAPLAPALWLLAAILGTALAVWFIWWLLHRQRTESMQDLAQRLNLAPLTLDEAAAAAIMNLLTRFELGLNAGWNLHSVLQGPVGPDKKWELCVLDLRGDPFGRFARRGDLAMTALLLRRPGVDLPKFLVIPKNYLSRAMAGATAPEVGFGDPFTRNNRLVGPDRDVLRRLFTLPVRAVLRGNRRLTIEGCGDSLLLYDFPSHMTGRQVDAALDLGLQLFAALQIARRATSATTAV